MEEKKRKDEKLKETIVCKTQTESDDNTEDVKVSKKTLRPIYERDSMERFGDDLTEEVLQYLWFSDKVMFECLSKQWQRLVFNKQMEIDLKDEDYRSITLSNRLETKNSLNKLTRIGMNNEYYMKALESVLKKCPNISRVYLPNVRGGEELELITKYCGRVRKLLVHEECDEKALMSFAAKHGMWLQEIVYVEDYGFGRTFNCIDSFLNMCPNIRKIDIENGWYLGNLNKTLFNTSLDQLEVISILVFEYKSNELKQLFDNYGKSLKGLKIKIAFTSSEELKTCFAHISRFESLESFELEFESIIAEPVEEPIDEYLKLLANKCTKLRKLCLRTNYSSALSNRFFFALSEFRSLEKLFLHFEVTTDKLEGSVECLKHMTRLKHLSIEYEDLTRNFFANIQTHLPNLRCLYIKYIAENSIKPFVESLQTMECIERVVINYKTFFYSKNRSESKPRIISFIQRNAYY